MLRDFFFQAGLRRAAALAAPTVPPMHRAPFTNLAPDYAVVGPGVRGQGLGAVRAAGFWDHAWAFDPATGFVGDCWG